MGKDGGARMSEREKFDRGTVDAVFHELWRRLDPAPAWQAPGIEAAVQCPHALCERMCAVGGYRRGKREMKDLELLYIPRIAARVDGADLFGAERETNLTEALWAELLAAGVLDKRLKITGAVSAWGEENKHARHVASGLPLDLFAATAENWVNRLVVTTGSAAHNIRIAETARKLGWEWEVYDAGFVPLGGTWAKCAKTRRTMRSEHEVFEFVKMPYLRPEERR